MGKLTFVLHDESVNTYGFRMLTSGANLEEFKKNPVMLLNHDDYSLPIGRWENIRVEGGKILADAVFDEGDARAAEVKRKVENDFIRMASIGAWPPEEKSDAYDLMLPGTNTPYRYEMDGSGRAVSLQSEPITMRWYSMTERANRLST